MKKSPEGYREVFCRYITKNGKRIYPKKAKVFHFFVKTDKR
jgi:Zn/Cd-binding protein ZinT